MKQIAVLALVFLIVPAVYGQEWMLYVYDVDSNTLDSSSVAAVEDSGFRATNWFAGSLPGRTDLPDTMPAPSDSFGSMSRMVPARQHTNVSHYPARAACAIRVVRDTTTGASCSAVLIGNRWALTSGHCIWNQQPIGFKQDEYRIYPAWDDSSSQTPVRYARVIRAYCVNNTDRFFVNDVTLLELDAPIGEQVGWVGMMTLPRENTAHPWIAHRLSYPSSRDLRDTARRYDGDTLWYRYGRVFQSVLTGENWIHCDSCIATGGESGSPVLIRYEGGYATIATQKSAYGMMSVVMHPTIFETLRSIMSGSQVSVVDSQTSEQQGVDSPFAYALATVYNVLGEQIGVVTLTSSGKLATEDLESLPLQALWARNGYHIKRVR